MEMELYTAAVMCHPVLMRPTAVIMMTSTGMPDLCGMLCPMPR